MYTIKYSMDCCSSLSQTGSLHKNEVQQSWLQKLLSFCSIDENIGAWEKKLVFCQIQAGIWESVQEGVNLCNMSTGPAGWRGGGGKSAELCCEQLLQLEELQLLQLLREYANEREGGPAGLITMTWHKTFSQNWTKYQNCVKLRDSASHGSKAE